MKQKKGSKNCMAIVACMATGCTVFDVDNFLGYNSADKGIIDLDFYRFMLHRGYVVGLVIEHRWNEGLKITSEKSLLQLDYSIDLFPACVIVKSDNYPENGHAVYWDKHKVWDPNPSKKDGMPLTEYVIYRWMPIIKVENRSPDNTIKQLVVEREKVIF